MPFDDLGFRHPFADVGHPDRAHAHHEASIALDERAPDARWPGEIVPFLRMRVGRVPAGDAQDRRLERIEAALRHLRGEFRAEARGQGRFMHDDAAPGFVHRRLDGVDVERQQRAQIDDLRVDPGLLGRRLRNMDHRAIAEDGYALALAPDRGLAERHDIAPRWRLAQRVLRPRNDGLVGMARERAVVEPLRLEKDDRIVVLDRGDQKPLGVVRVGRDDGLEAGDVGEQSLRALAGVCPP